MYDFKIHSKESAHKSHLHAKWIIKGIKHHSVSVFFVYLYCLGFMECCTSSRVLDGALLELLASGAAGADTDGFTASFLRSLRGLSRDNSTVASE